MSSRTAGRERPVGAYVTALAAGLGVFATFALVFYLLSGPRDLSSCNGGRIVPAPAKFIYMLACIGSFAVGGLVTRGTRGPPPDALGAKKTQPRTVLQIALLIGLAVLAALLGYEAWSLSPLNSNTGEFWPLTWFVRCASRLAWLAALPIVMSMSGFFGKWLWYRPGLRA